MTTFHTGITDPARPGDQAARLRAVVAAHPRPARPRHPALPESRPAPAPVITVSSGKGGGGKTNLSVNLSIALAELGRRTVLIDADLGMANADVICGMAPTRRLDQAVAPANADKPRHLRDLLVDAPGGFRLVPGAVGVERMADLGPDERDRLVRSLTELEHDADLIIVDTGAGMSRAVTSFMHAADVGIVVATPDPASITDAYALIKCILAPAGARPEPDEPPARSHLVLVVNQVTGEKEARAVHARIEAVSTRFLGYRLPLLGWVMQDARVATAVRRRRPVLLDSPDCRASADLRDTALRLVRGLRQPVGVNAPESRRSGFARALSRLFLRGG